MKTFYLDRIKDVTGSSNIGIFAQGVRFDNGSIVICWIRKISIIMIYEDIESVKSMYCYDESVVIRWGDNNVFRRGESDAFQDRCENAPFGSTGGIDKRLSMIAPYYILENDVGEYLAGYRACCFGMFGIDWETCQFGWDAAVTIGGQCEPGFFINSGDK